MPTSAVDAVATGETLKTGECLTSRDGRFRFYLLDSGPTVYGYKTDGGRVQLWTDSVTEALGLVVKAGDDFDDGAWASAALIFSEEDQQHTVASGTDDYGYGVDWRLLMQADGNLTFNHYRTNGIKTPWAAGCYVANVDSQNQSKYVIPNAPVAEVISGGQVAISTTGDGTITNTADIPICVRDSANCVVLQPGDKVLISAAQPGTVNIQLNTYNVNLVGGSPSADAVPNDSKSYTIQPGDSFDFKVVKGPQGLRLA